MTRLVAMLLAVATMASCSVLRPEERANARVVVQEEYDAGNITRAQRDAMIEALDNDEPVDWSALGLAGLSLLSGMVGGPMIVRRVRGPATQKVGLPASKVHQ